MTLWRIAEVFLFCGAFIGGIAIQQWRFHDSPPIQPFRDAGWEIVKSAKSAHGTDNSWLGGQRAAGPKAMLANQARDELELAWNWPQAALATLSAEAARHLDFAGDFAAPPGR